MSNRDQCCTPWVPSDHSTWQRILLFQFLLAFLVLGTLSAQPSLPQGWATAPVIEIDIQEFSRHPDHLDIELDAQPRRLELVPVSNRAPGFQLLVEDDNGVLSEQTPPPTATYRGRLSDDADSFAAVTLVHDGIEGRIETGEGRVFWIEPPRGRRAGLPDNAHFIYEHIEGEEPGTCAALPNPDPLFGSADSAEVENSSIETAGIQIAEIACDADFEYFQRWGSVSAVQTRIESVLNTVNVQFERDVAITHQITTLIIRTSEPDPYSATDPSSLLVQFRDHWWLNHTSVQRDTAHLFTGKNLDGSVIGIAYRPGMCSNYAYGVSQSDFTTSFACVTDLTAHELGHNWNAPHCSCPSFTMNPSITCANVFSSTTISTITSFRDSLSCLTEDPGLPPAAPSDLVANTLSDTEIQLSWTDNAINETGMDIERSLDEITWILIDTTGPDAETYTDQHLTPETQYSYRVTALNAAGRSAPSNIASATTDPAPPPPTEQDILAHTQTLVAGTVTGSISGTFENDEIAQSIQERSSGGRKSRRYSFLEHLWHFNLPVSSSATLFVDAWTTASEDDFLFEYSTNNGTSYAPAVFASQGNLNQRQGYALPPGTSGSVLVRVTDTDQTPGALTLDTVHVDELIIQVSANPEPAPDAPTNLNIDLVTESGVALSWIDTAINELGTQIERRTSGGVWQNLASVGVDVTTYIDTSILPNTTYDYRVFAFNAGGNSAPSNVASATTPDFTPALNLVQATGFKVKGVQHAQLTWTGGGPIVSILRNGQIIATIPNTGSFEDNIGAKGGGSYNYQVCDDGGSPCSNTLTVTF